jgi:hypothetical protein
MIFADVQLEIVKWSGAALMAMLTMATLVLIVAFVIAAIRGKLP